jgi:hypothetical protein
MQDRPSGTARINQNVKLHVQQVVVRVVNLNHVEASPEAPCAEKATTISLKPALRGAFGTGYSSTGFRKALRRHQAIG